MSNENLPKSLDGVGVIVDGKDAWIYYISPDQILFLTPDLANSGEATYAGYPELLVGVRARLSRPGDTLLLFGSGFGPKIPSGLAGTIASVAALANVISVFVGGLVAVVEYAGVVSPGLAQLNVRIPDLEPGDCEVTVRVGGSESQARVFFGDWAKIDRD